jgi:hypothetical protein
MKITVEDFIDEIHETGMDRIETIYDIHNSIIDIKDDAVTLINKMISHFSKTDSVYLEQIKTHIEECGKYNWLDEKHPVNKFRISSI